MHKSSKNPRPNKKQPQAKPILRPGEEINAEETFLPLLAIAGLWGVSRKRGAAGGSRFGYGGSGGYGVPGYGAGYGAGMGGFGGFGGFGGPAYGAGYGPGWGGYGAGYGSGWGGYGGGYGAKAGRFPFFF